MLPNGRNVMVEQSQDDGHGRQRPVLLTASEADQVARLLKILSGDERPATDRPSGAPSAAPASIDAIPTGEIARRLYGARRARQKFLPNRLFRDYAWDMLLALYIRSLADQSSYIGQIIKLADASFSTGLRYLALLEEHGLIERQSSDTDQRMVRLQFTKQGRRMMDEYFEYLREASLDLPGSGAES